VSETHTHSGGKLDDITVMVAAVQQGIDDSGRDNASKPSRPSFNP
jgi:hypothetical protein